jgi:methylase of polypeptide subunit release factors
VIVESYNVKNQKYKYFYYIMNQEVTIYNKEMNGEVTTPNCLIDEMYGMLDKDIFKNSKAKWLDPCAGTGVFFERLFSNHLLSLPYQKNKNFWTTEINKKHVDLLKHKFGNLVNVTSCNFLQFKQTDFDVIVANPPFQTGGSIKVPTMKKDKKKDGKEMWSYFVKHAMSLLKDDGVLLMITPTIWLKRDHKMHEYIMNYQVKQIKCYDAGEANKLFHGRCQSPIVVFRLDKTINKNLVQNIKVGEMFYRCGLEDSIPMKYYNIITKLRPYVNKYGCLNAVKTSMRPGRPNDLVVSKSQNEIFPYANIKTCLLKKRINGKKSGKNISPFLVIEYSNIPCVFYGIRKLVLAHKMRGYCYFDKEGEYGISNRDNYVLVDYTETEMEILNRFLNLECVMDWFDATRYRMRYLERYIFDFIPNVTSLPDFPQEITEKSVKDYFGI